MRGSRVVRPKKATDTASNASPIMGENMRISAARRRAPARPDLKLTWGLKASTNRSTKTSMVGFAELKGDKGPYEQSDGGLLPSVLPELLELLIPDVLLLVSGSSSRGINSSSSSEETRRTDRVQDFCRFQSTRPSLLLEPENLRISAMIWSTWSTGATRIEWNKVRNWSIR